MAKISSFYSYSEGVGREAVMEVSLLCLSGNCYQFFLRNC
jgi:hypothetical protein